MCIGVIGGLEDNDLTFEIQEQEMDEDKLKKNMNFSYTCTDCQSNLAVCYKCKSKGYFFPELQGKNKSNKKFEFPPSPSSNDKKSIEEEKDGNSEQVVPESDAPEKSPSQKIDEEKDEEKDDSKEDDKEEERSRKNGQELKLAKTMENVLTKCSTANCNKFYHLECIKDNVLFKYFDSNKHKKFRCSLHYCAKCSISGDTMAIAQCIRCPKSYHLKCYPKDKITKLTKKLIICQVSRFHST